MYSNCISIGRNDLLSYYGCVESFSPPIQFKFLLTLLPTENSVSFNFTIMSSNQYFQGKISLLDSSDNIVQEYSLRYQPVGTITTGFYGLNQNTTYSIEISVGNLMQEIYFTTNSLSSGQNISCSPLGEL